MNGYIDALIYVILTAVSFVFLNQLISEIDPWLALLVMSGIALAGFNGANFSKITASYQVIWREKLLWVFMAATLAIDWISMVFASYYSDPFIAMAALFIATAFFGFAQLYWRQRRLAYLCSCGLLILVMIFTLFSYHILNGKSSFIGIVLGLAAGGAFYGYIASSARLAKRGNLNSLQVLATRFWGVFIVALFFVNWQQFLQLDLKQFGQLLLVSFGALIIPIYFNQQAIAKIGAEAVAVFISMVPPLTYIIYAFYQRQFNLLNALVCLVITVALVLPKLFIRKRNRV